MADEGPPLAAEIRKAIGAAGPMPVAAYMQLCLTHPRYGYYTTRDPLGARGDFVTAPEISQMFGELTGLWLAALWQQLGAPVPMRLIELGPGRASMLIDALRASRTVPGFLQAVVLHLVEVSPVLRLAQQQRLAPLRLPAHWHGTLDEVPAGPCLIVANEFVDALPVHQAVKLADGWHERVVTLDAQGALTTGVAAAALADFDVKLPDRLRLAPDGAIFEWRPHGLAQQIGQRVRQSGAALIIDYGHARAGLGETWQAVRGHAYADPLDSPGQADLTAHVDFQALAQAAQRAGARVHGPVTQRQWLRRLGIEARAAVLKAHAPCGRAAEIDQALARLTADGARGMGALCKAIAITDPKLTAVPGFVPAP